MKLLHILSMILILSLSSPLLPQQEIKQDSLHIKLAKEFVETLVTGDFISSVTRFDSTMKSLMPAEKTEEIWNGLLNKLGTFHEQIAVRQEKYKQYKIVYVTCQFKHSQFDVKVVFNPQNQITGLFFVPTKEIVQWETPEYADKNLFAEIDVTIGEKEWELPGNITIPHGEGPFPALVLVHGSGPNDRDETIGPNKPFRDLAWGLASRGIAVMRYDKRTKVHGVKMVFSKHRLTVKEEAVEDAVYGVNTLKKTKRIDPENVFVLGHSLGGMLIPRIGKTDSSITGFIIMAGATRPIEEIIIEQYEYIFSLDGQLTREEQGKIQQTRDIVQMIKGLTLADTSAIEKNFLGASPSYWLDLRGYDPPREAQKLQNPIYILQGGRDYQVTKVDFERWESGLDEAENVRFKLYPALDHLFIAGKGKSSPGDYQNPGHVDKEVINDIATWIKGIVSSDK
ncbi:DUF3887 domain-containing protein [bacterium]